jgi:hypothetical protein
MQFSLVDAFQRAAPVPQFQQSVECEKSNEGARIAFAGKPCISKNSHDSGGNATAWAIRLSYDFIRA